MSLYYNDEEFEYTSQNEVEHLIADLPFNLIKENIIEQINDPVTTNVNYVDVLMDKINLFRHDFAENADILAEMNIVVKEFFIFVLEKMNDKFSLGLDLETISTYHNIEEIGISMYKYFVLRYSKNITKFMTQYIFKNKKIISEKFADKTKKDVSTLAFRKQIKDKNDLTILTNLPSIIQDIINSDISSTEFIKYSISNDNYDAYIIRGLIDNNIMTGYFYDAYVELCVNNHDHIIDELQTEIRSKIIKKIMD